MHRLTESESPPSTSKKSLQGFCEVCGRSAFCRNYGVISCDACKMFFRRSIVEKLKYSCEKSRKCFENLSALRIPYCRFCRLQRCRTVGMKFTCGKIMEVKNHKNDRLAKLVQNLVKLDTERHVTFVNFYGKGDPSLEEILVDPGVLRFLEKPPEVIITPHEWSFFGVHSIVKFFSKFQFVQSLSEKDKLLIFQQNTLKSSLLCGAMRVQKENRNKLITPGGQDIFPDRLIEKFDCDPKILIRIGCLIVGRLIELKVTHEEFVLLNLIFFCNPALSSISEHAITILSTQQKFYASCLLQHCQLNHQQSGPSRFADLLSILHIINRNVEDLQYLIMMFQCHIPGFQFKKLVVETYCLAGNLKKLQIKK